MTAVQPSNFGDHPFHHRPLFGIDLGVDSFFQNQEMKRAAVSSCLSKSPQGLFHFVINFLTMWFFNGKLWG